MMMAGLPALSSVVLEHPEDYLSFEKTLKENEATALVVIDDIFALLHDAVGANVWLCHSRDTLRH